MIKYENIDNGAKKSAIITKGISTMAVKIRWISMEAPHLERHQNVVL